MYNIISRGWITTTALITCLSGQVRDLPRLLSPHRTGPAGKEVHVLCLFAAVYVSLSMNSVRAPGRPRKRVQRYALFHSPPNIAETFFREKQLFFQKRKIHLFILGKKFSTPHFNIRIPIRAIQRQGLLPLLQEKLQQERESREDLSFCFPKTTHLIR